MTEICRELNNLFAAKDKQGLFVTPEKPKSALRWIVLALGCFLLVGSYYCENSPAALKNQMDDYFGDPSYFETYFSLIYTLYSAPNVILPFFGGYFVDKFGVRLCLLIFTSLIGIGQIIFALGISIKSWPVIFLGRLIFGFGGESLIVADSALLADWFRGKELAFAFGINLSIARVGSVVNNVLSPLLTEKAGLVFALWFGCFVCAFSIICVLLVIPIDKAMDERLNVREPLLSLEQSDDAEKNNELANDLPEPQFRDVISFPFIFWVCVVLCIIVYSCVVPFNNIAATLLLERNYFIEPDAGCALQQPGCQSATNQPNMMCTTSKWYQPPLPYDVKMPDGTYYAQVTSSDIDCTSSMWKDVCTVDYCNRLADGEAQAAVIMSIPYIISGCLSPFLGIAVDRYGYRAFIAALAPMCLIVVHCCLAFTSVSPVILLVGQGLAYTGFAAVLWPAIPLIIEERFTGLGYGVVTSTLNLGCAIVPLVIASVYNEHDAYIPYVEVIFICLACIGALDGIYLNIYDLMHGSVLNTGTLTPDDDNDGDAVEDSNKSGSIGGDRKYDHEYSQIVSANENDEVPTDTTSTATLVSNSNSDHFTYTTDSQGCSDSTNTTLSTVSSPFGSVFRPDVRSYSTEASSRNVDSDMRRQNGRSVDHSSGQFSLHRRHYHPHEEHPHHSHNRTRGSSFTAYEQIHRGGGF